MESCIPEPEATTSDRADVVAFLTRLAGAPPVETHISRVFVGIDTVWKLKKSVRLPFLDFTRVEDRRRFCERELALNAPGAPGLYRDVVPVVRLPDHSLALGGEGEIVDWVLRMAPVPPGDFLDVRAAASGLPPAPLDRVADAVAAYHAALAPIPDFEPDMAAIAEGNARSGLTAGCDAAKVEAWRDAILFRLKGIAAWCDARAKAGFVRRCHGDLHLGNLCLWRGRPVLFDALEFDEALATIDVAYDLAFLLMDAEHRLDRAAANRLLNRYVARTGDAALVAGLPVFLSMRAMVRAHVEARSGHAGLVGGYLTAAGRYLAPGPAVVVAIGGLPGTGKSTVGRALAPLLGPAPGALLLRSDEIRKRQNGAEPETRLPESAYSLEKSVAVFDELAKSVGLAASGGHAAVADATFLDVSHRAMVEAAAKHAGVPFVGIWLSAPLAVLEARVAARTGDASDATVAILRRASVNDPGPLDWHAVDATDGEAALALVKSVVRSHLAF